MRARIALACAGLFLVVGGVLIAGTYELTGHFAAPAVIKSLLGAGARYYRDYCQPGHAAEIRLNPAAAAKCRTAEQVAAVVAARDTRASDRRLFLLYSLAGLAFTTVLAGALGWAAGGRVLRPLRMVTDAARTASQENLDRRLALAGPPDELKELADTFDGMLARLEAAFASQKRFVANASHELRTPLTEMRALIDVALAKPSRSAAQLETVVTGVRAAVDASERLIEALLTLARSDRGLSISEVVDLPTAVDDAVDAVSSAAAARPVIIKTALEDASVVGDRVLLERMIGNLVDNAVRYNVPGGHVLVTTAHAGGQVLLTVANDGEQIGADQVPGLFEPFRRLNGRVAGQPGSGLGLSIVASVAAAHGGSVRAHTQPGGGLKVIVGLPAAGGPPG